MARHNPGSSARYVRLLGFLIVLFLFLSLSSLKPVHAICYIVEEKTKIVYPNNRNHVQINETVTLHIDIYNTGSPNYDCVMKILGEGFTISPSREENITIRGYPYHTITQFQLKPNQTGTLPVGIQLWYQGSQIDFFSVSMKVLPPPLVPVQIEKEQEQTFISPNPAFLDTSSAILTVYVTNLGQSDVHTLVKVHVQNVDILPGNEQNKTIGSLETISLEFRLIPEVVGSFNVVIELWFENAQVDSHILDFSVQERTTVVIAFEVFLTPFIMFGLVSTAHFLKKREKYDYNWLYSLGYGFAGFIVILVIGGICLVLVTTEKNVLYDWILTTQIAKVINSFVPLSSLEATVFNTSLSALTFVLLSYLSFLGLREIVERYIAIICGILVGFLSALTIYRLTTLQNLYESLFAGFGMLPALVLTILFALIVFGLSKRIKIKQSRQ